MIKSAKATIKTTGERFWYEVKQSWNKLYYSFDGGLTWCPSKSEAYKAARDAGTLQPATD